MTSFPAPISGSVVEGVQVLQRGLQNLGIVRPYAEDVAVTEVVVSELVMTLFGYVVQFEQWES